MHTPKFFFTLLILSLSFICGCQSHALVNPLSPPPNPEQIVGTWLGLRSGYAYRLDLHNDRTGVLLTTWLPDQGFVRKYETDHWELNEFELFGKFTAVNFDGGPIYLRARADATSLRRVSFAEHGGPPVAEEFIRESQVRAWLELLTDSNLTFEQ